MKLKLRFFRLQDNAKHRSLVNQQLEPLAKEIPFDQAQVTLAKPDEGSDRIEASVHLAVPGPDIRVKATDYTVEAAWRKLARLVRETWQHRLRKRLSFHQGLRLNPARARS